MLCVVFLKPSVSITPSVPPSDSHKCLRFGLSPTLHTLKDFIYLLTFCLLTYLLTYLLFSTLFGRITRFCCYNSGCANIFIHRSRDAVITTNSFKNGNHAVVNFFSRSIILLHAVLSAMPKIHYTYFPVTSPWTEKLQTCRLCRGLTADLLRGSHRLVTDLLRGNWLMDFGIITATAELLQFSCSVCCLAGLPNLQHVDGRSIKGDSTGGDG